MIQLNPPLPLSTPRGEGWAHLVTWDSLEHSIYWTVFLDDGAVWTFRNEEVRACKNATAERPKPEKPIVLPYNGVPYSTDPGRAVCIDW